MNQLTKPVVAVLKPNGTIAKFAPPSTNVLGETVIRRVVKQTTSPDIKAQATMPDGRKFLIKKITRSDTQKGQETSSEEDKKKVLRARPSNTPEKKDRVVPVFTPPRQPQRPPEKKVPIVTRPPVPSPQQNGLSPRVIYDVPIKGLPVTVVKKLPSTAVAFIQKIEAENMKLKKLLLEFRTKSLGLANSLITFSNDINPFIASIAPETSALKRKVPDEDPSSPLPQEKKVKKIIRLPKFPLASVNVLTSFEKDLIADEYRDFVGQKLMAGLNARDNDITENNIFDLVLTEMIKVDVLGDISYDKTNDVVTPFQVCFRPYPKFKNLFATLVNTLAHEYLGRAMNMVEVEDYLIKKLDVHGKKLKTQTMCEKVHLPPQIKLTKIKVSESQAGNNKESKYRWVEDDEEEV